jgi:hypothetical protein
MGIHERSVRGRSNRDARRQMHSGGRDASATAAVIANGSFDGRKSTKGHSTMANGLAAGTADA